MSQEAYMLTTIDNPFDPFTEFDAWYQFDEEKGYHTCSYLSRIAKTSDELSDEDNQIELNNAMNAIIAHDVFNIYKKVKENKIKETVS